MSAVLLLLASGAAQSQNLVTGGSFGTTGSCDSINDTIEQFNPAAPGLAIDTWLGIDKWTVNDGEFGDDPDCYASFEWVPPDAYNRGRLFQGFAAPSDTGMYSVAFDYVYEDGEDGDPGPYFWVLGVNSSDPSISQFSGGGDGFPDGPGQDITNWDVLYQQKLAGPCTLTDCPNGPSLPVGSASSPVQVIQPFHVPAIYDYWVVVASYGCNDFAGENCDTSLRGLDDVVVELVEADEEGPATDYIVFDPNAAIVGTPFSITALVDDTGLGDSNIASAEYTIDGGISWMPMNALDGFDSPQEIVTAINPGEDVGTYELCVRGTDAGGNVGPEDCSQLVVYNPIAESGGVNIPISNQCAQFYTLENPDSEHEITTLNYGETIIFDTDFHINSALDIPAGEFKFHAQAKGDGVGATSEIKYQFKLNSMLKADISPYFDPSIFEFRVKAKIVGQAQEVDGYGILNGAQNNAELLFKLRIRYESYQISFEAFDFSVECAGDPWTNVTENRDSETGEPLGNGFLDPWNKYIWSMAEFKGGVFAGTKNATYNFQSIISPSVFVATCLADPTVPEPYRPFACLELFGNTGDRNSRGGEIWRFDLKKKHWTLVEDSADPTSNDSPQGFRDMVVHDGVLYVAADLGAFISGVTYNAPFNPLGPFTYPGVTLLKSEDGVTFTEVNGACVSDGFCRNGDTVGVGAIPDANISIRALASAGGDLYIGTFNASGTPALDGDGGGQVWKYDGSSFDLVWETGSSLLPIVGEIEEYGGKLYVGIGGDPSVLETQSIGGPNNYLFECELSSGCDNPLKFTPVTDLPDIDPNTFFVIKLFVGKGQLWLGTANFAHGFSLLSYDGTDWDLVVDGPIEGGFFNRFNIYNWAMAEVDGRLFLGTGNELLVDELPRGEAELWYTDDGIDWFEYPLPIDWGFLNYGIRSMDFAGRKLFLGSASDMVAPDALYPGGQVWTIRDTKVNSPSGGGGSKGNGKKTH